MVRQIDPMLAYKPPVGIKGEKLIADIIADTTGDWVWDEKKDGSRYLPHFLSGQTTYTGRRVSDVTGFLSETTGGKLQHLNFSIPELNGTIADAEYMGTSAASMTQHPLFIFDVLSFKGQDIMHLPMRKRKRYKQQVLDIILKNYPQAPVKVLPQYGVTKAVAEFERIIAAGGEGLVLKNLNSIYIPGARSRDAWVKYKKEETFDVVVIGYTESTSQKYGPKGLNSFRHLIAGQYNDDGDLVEVCHIPATGFIDQAHRDLVNIGIKNLVGLVAEVGAMERASKGIKLRHPRFLRWRDDKNAKDCTID